MRAGDMYHEGRRYSIRRYGLFSQFGGLCLHHFSFRAKVVGSSGIYKIIFPLISFFGAGVADCHVPWTGKKMARI